MADIPSHAHFDFSAINFYLNLGILVLLPLLVWGLKSWLSGLVNRDVCSAMQTKCRIDFERQIREDFMDKETGENQHSSLQEKVSCLEKKLTEVKDENSKAHSSIVEKIMENRDLATREISELRTLIIKALYRRGADP